MSQVSRDVLGSFLGVGHAGTDRGTTRVISGDKQAGGVEGDVLYFSDTRLMPHMILRNTPGPATDPGNFGVPVHAKQVSDFLLWLQRLRRDTLATHRLPYFRHKKAPNSLS